MYKNMIALNEEEMVLVYGGRDENVASFVELLGTGLGLLSKMLYRACKAIADNLAYADVPGYRR